MTAAEIDGYGFDFIQTCALPSVLKHLPEFRLPLIDINRNDFIRKRPWEKLNLLFLNSPAEVSVVSAICCLVK